LSREIWLFEYYSKTPYDHLSTLCNFFSWAYASLLLILWNFDRISTRFLNNHILENMAKFHLFLGYRLLDTTCWSFIPINIFGPEDYMYLLTPPVHFSCSPNFNLYPWMRSMVQYISIYFSCASIWFKSNKLWPSEANWLKFTLHCSGCKTVILTSFEEWNTLLGSYCRDISFDMKKNTSKMHCFWETKNII